MSSWMRLPGFLDLVDILLVAGFGWLAIGYFWRTRARGALAGLAMLAVVYFVARGLELEVTAALLQAFFAVVVIVLVVVFQEDLRRLFEGLGSWRPGRPPRAPGLGAIDQLARAVARMADARTGALIVLPGSELIDRHIEGGVALGGRLSEPLLLSLFDSSSPGHDGAVIVRDGVVERFAVHLPLSANHEAVGPGGTRHAAALGLSERCDASVIAVSEERGSISLARNGSIQILPRAEDLVRALRSTFEAEPAGVADRREHAMRDAAIALAGAILLWMVFVPGSDVTERTFAASVEVTNLPPDLELDSITPMEVEVTLSGIRRDVLLADESDLSVRVDGYLARLGRRTFALSPELVQRPDGVRVIAVSPDKIKLSLRNRSPEATAAPP